MFETDCEGVKFQNVQKNRERYNKKLGVCQQDPCSPLWKFTCSRLISSNSCRIANDVINELHSPHASTSYDNSQTRWPK